MPASDEIGRLLDEGAALHRRGALREAGDCYARVLASEPAHATALHRLAQINCQQGRFGDGVDLLRRALAAEPERAASHVLLGRALAELGRMQEALASFDAAIACDDRYADAHGNRGDLLARLGRLPEAIECYQRAIAIAPAALDNWCNLGAAQAELGRQADALASYEQAIALDPNFFEGHVIRGNLLAALGRSADALASYDRALAIMPDAAPVLTSRADVLVKLDRPEEAVASLDRALALAPQDLDALSNRGFLLQSLGRFDEALASVDRALAINPQHPAALTNRGALLSDLGRHADALAAFDRALALMPADVKLHCNRAKTLIVLNRDHEALVAIEGALAIDPAHVESIFARGVVLVRINRHDEAIAAFERVLALQPSHASALAQMVSCCMAICAWDQVASVAGRLCDIVSADTAVVAPGILLQFSADPALTMAAARRYVAREIVAGREPVSAPPRPSGDRIRVAYLSADFRAHPVADLVAELLERHDRRRFEVIGLSIGVDDKSDVRARIAKSCNRFQDLRAVGDREAAEFIRSAGVDVVVDLGGHTDNARPRILSYRPAPVQVNYLGYAGTMGADFIDYIIADATVLPSDQQPHYAEKIVHLPDCYMVSDTTKPISPNMPSRAAAGLPPHGFVFCCFNNAYKISADIFQIWMRLLTRIDGSVLWLSQLNKPARDNLRNAARAAGVDPGRIIFAPRVPTMADHLARHRLADLFVDTPVYNAHTTANDALWAGLPVLTCIGATFPGRVAASLLRSVGLPDLVTATLDEYEALALELAREPALLVEVRRRLERNRSTYPLFDTGRFARHLERAYETMCANAREGRGPQSFSVEPLGGL